MFTGTNLSKLHVVGKGWAQILCKAVKDSSEKLFYCLQLHKNIFGFLPLKLVEPKCENTKSFDSLNI